MEPGVESHLNSENGKKGESGRQCGVRILGPESHLNCENRRNGETEGRYGVRISVPESHLNSENGKKGETGEGGWGRENHQCVSSGG